MIVLESKKQQKQKNLETKLTGKSNLKNKFKMLEYSKMVCNPFIYLLWRLKDVIDYIQMSRDICQETF